jgi:hypothetical protein
VPSYNSSVRTPRITPFSIFNNACLELRWLTNRCPIPFTGMCLLTRWPAMGINVTILMKSSASWDITSCSPLKASRHFGWTCRLHLQVRRISRAKYQRGSRRQAEQAETFNGLHGVTSQKIEIFMAATVRTSNLNNDINNGYHFQHCYLHIQLC